VNRISDLRKELGLSQEELGKRFKLSQQTISGYENLTREPDNETLKQLAEFFNVSVDYILGHSDIRNSSKTTIETKAYHNLDTSGLPEEDIRKVEEYVELLKKKYNPDGTLK
jgi:transcriptional regulator with XRE-family HTH domain